MKKADEKFKDVYRAPPWPPGEPDYAWQIPEELEKQLRHHQIRSAVLALFSLLLLFTLAAVLVRETRMEPASMPMLKPEEDQYVPHYTLPADDLWVMSYQQARGNLQFEGAQGDKPISIKWVKNVAYHVIIGQQALTVEHYEKAATHFEKALTVFPEMHGVNGSLGMVYLKQQRFKEAISPLRKAIQEEESFSTRSNLGFALLATKHFAEAEACLLQALALNPKHPGGYKNLALLYQKTERPEKALRYFEDYFSRYREDFYSIENYAEYLLELGQKDRAARFLAKACQQQTKNALPLYLLLAKTEARAGNEVQAVGALKNITKYLSPNIALTEMSSTDFDTIRETEGFRTLLHQIELAAVTLENKP